MHCLLFLALTALAPSQQPTPLEVTPPQRDTPVSYANEIADLLADTCGGCHSSALAENDLNMEDIASMLKGGKSGPSLVPGKSDDSLLFRLASHRADPVMPPKDKPDLKPLTPDQLGLLKLWIDQGAKDDSDSATPAASSLTLAALPASLKPIYSLDMTSDGTRLAAGRANLVHVYEPSTGAEIIRLGGHQDLVQSLRFSPDGKKLAVGGYQNVLVWNVPAGAAEKTLSAHQDQVQAIASSPDGAFFATGGLDRSIKLWPAGADQPSRQWDLPDGAQVTALIWSPDGTSLVSGGSDGKVRFWSKDDGSQLREVDTKAGPVRSLALSPDAHRLLSGSDDGTARLFSLPDDRAQPPADPLLLPGHNGPVSGAGFSADGAQLVTSSKDGKVRVWDASNGSNLRTIDGPGQPIHAMSVSGAGNRLATALEDGTARLFSLADGTPGPVLRGHTGAVRSVSFSADGTRVATAGQDGAVKVSDSVTGLGLVAFAHLSADPNAPAQPLNAVAFSGPNRVVSGSSDRSVRTWTFDGAWTLDRVLGPHLFRVLALDFSPDGSKLATGGGEPSRSGELKIWDLSNGSLLLGKDDWHSDTIFSVRFSPDGTRLATAGADKFVRVLTIADGKLVRSFEGHTHHVLAVDWKNDGKQLASSGADKVVKFWEVETGDQLRTSQEAGGEIASLRWVPGKNEVLGASGDRTVRSWNPENGQVQRNYGGPNDFMYSVACNADGLRLSGGGEEGIVYVWRGDNGQLLRQIAPPPDPKDPSLLLEPPAAP